MFTPHSLPISRAHMPAQLTANSHSITPRFVDTPVTAPSRWSMPVTTTSSNSRTPFVAAPAASAFAVCSGSASPSLGMWSAPTRSSVRISGHISPASRRLIGSTSIPKDLPSDAIFLSSSMRPSVRATVTLPDWRNPVGWPVSASSPP